MRDIINSKKGSNIMDQESKVKVKGVYRHYGGDYYIVEGIGTHTETMEKMVIYRGLYGNNEVWIRPLDMFIEEVENKDQKHRFELQHIESKKHPEGNKEETHAGN